MRLSNPSAILSAATRARDLEELSGGAPVDVLVVGGGITGAGVALDAASRGLSTALLERRDLAFGTSRWSSKLVHGGLRYLATGQFDLALQSARERHWLMTAIAPHLVSALPFVAPFSRAHSRREAAANRAGIRVGEVLRLAAGTSADVLPRGRRLGAAAAREFFPGLGTLRSAVLHWDGQLLDDARLVVAVARTAASFGARILTRAQVTGVVGEEVAARDTLTGESFSLRARTVVFATGVYTGELAASVALRPSRGTHLVLRGDALGSPRAAMSLLVPGTRSRWVFAVPQPDRLLSQTSTVLVGLTDDPVEEVDEVPAPGPHDEEYLLAQLGSALGRAPERSAVLASFAGLRPLIAGDPASTADLSRRHQLSVDPATGAFVLVGGKLTTYRAMAEDAVDAVVARLGRGGTSRTRRIVVVGGAERLRLANLRAPKRLVTRYGLEALDLLALAEGRPQLLEPVAPGLEVLGVELLWGALVEGGLLPEDLTERRVRLGLVGAADAATEVAEEMIAEATAKSTRYRR